MDYKCTTPVETLEAAHKSSISNRVSIQGSTECACFYCEEKFAPSDIDEWTDDADVEAPDPTEGEEADIETDVPRVEKDTDTAFCPKCHIDAVLGSAAGFDLTDVFLKDMNWYFFVRSE